MVSICPVGGKQLNISHIVSKLISGVARASVPALVGVGLLSLVSGNAAAEDCPRGDLDKRSVSYTHLTLPTILLV